MSKTKVWKILTHFSAPWAVIELEKKCQNRFSFISSFALYSERQTKASVKEKIFWIFLMFSRRHPRNINFFRNFFLYIFSSFSSIIASIQRSRARSFSISISTFSCCFFHSIHHWNGMKSLTVSRRHQRVRYSFNFFFRYLFSQTRQQPKQHFMS